jgi:hypothetical protein
MAIPMRVNGSNYALVLLEKLTSSGEVGVEVQAFRD